MKFAKEDLSGALGDLPVSGCYFFGFSRWKRRFVAPFFRHEGKLLFCRSLQEAHKRGLCGDSKIFIWGRKPFDEVESYAKSHNIPLFRVEDGFVRSVSLGSDLTKAYSLVVDSRGIYFDPTCQSDLEYLLNTHTFDEVLLQRAKVLRGYLVQKRISKYNAYRDVALELEGKRENRKVVLVPGQVEDDASIIYGANSMSNLELLKQARSNVPDAYIIYKPHPDVLAGNRKGHIAPGEALRYCDTIVTEASIDSVLALADEVHTMTSLVGFEALMRGKKVYTYGMPFYAGWGLTEDARECKRRTAKRTLDELVAATLILYPRYIDPRTDAPCDIETLLEALDKEKARYNNDIVYRAAINARNFISRKVQLLLKVMLGE